MNRDSSQAQSSVALVFRVLVVLEALTFFIAAVPHLGVPIQMGAVALAEPRIIPATIVETLCGLALALSAFAIFTRRHWAWTASTAGHAFAFAGVLLGITEQEGRCVPG